MDIIFTDTGRQSAQSVISPQKNYNINKPLHNEQQQHFPYIQSNKHQTPQQVDTRLWTKETIQNIKWPSKDVNLPLSDKINNPSNSRIQVVKDVNLPLSDKLNNPMQAVEDSIIQYHKKDKQESRSTQLSILFALFVFIIFATMQIYRVHQSNRVFMKQLMINESIQNQPLIEFRYFFQYNIKPTFYRFLRDYQNNIDTMRRFRLSRQVVISLEEQQYVTDIFSALQRINGDHIYENIYISGDTSYTIDKKNIYMCLTNWNQSHQNAVPLDVLVFVFLHECAHVACRDPQHSNEFWCIFRFILDVFCNYSNRTYKHLKICNLDMNKHPMQYCNGMQITYNPLFDSNTYLNF